MHGSVSLQLFLVVYIFLRSLGVICFHRWVLSESHKSYFKACVRYFLSNFYFSPNDSPSITMKNIFRFIEKALFVLKISQFFILVFLLFLPISHCFRAWSKIYLKVYHIINCLKKNFPKHLVSYWRSKKGMTLKLGQLIEY